MGKRSREVVNNVDNIFKNKKEKQKMSLKEKILNEMVIDKRELNSDSSVEDVRRIIYDLDSDYNIEPGCDVAVLLLSSLVVGVDSQRLSHFTGYPFSKVSVVARRLRENKIWYNGKVDSSDWLKSGISFWMDVSVGLGYANILN